MGDPRSGGEGVEGSYLPGPQDGPHFCSSAVTQPPVLARMRVREGDSVGAGERGTQIQERDRGQRIAGQSPNEVGTETQEKGDRFRKGSKRHGWEGVEAQGRERERTEREKAVTEGRKRRRRGKRHREGGGQRTRAGGTETQREDRGDPSGRGVLRTET